MTGQMIHIRVGAKRRTFHTHGVPFRTARADNGNSVGVKAWERSRPILARSYRDMRAFGLTPGQARTIVIDLMLVPSL